MSRGLPPMQAAARDFCLEKAAFGAINMTKSNMSELSTYRYSPIVEAWRFELGVEQPRWLLDALDASKIFYVDRGDKSYYSIAYDGGAVIRPGDYIVRHFGGGIRLVKKGDFDNNYVSTD